MCSIQVRSVKVRQGILGGGVLCEVKSEEFGDVCSSVFGKMSSVVACSDVFE